ACRIGAGRSARWPSGSAWPRARSTGSARAGGRLPRVRERTEVDSSTTAVGGRLADEPRTSEGQRADRQRHALPGALACDLRADAGGGVCRALAELPQPPSRSEPDPLDGHATRAGDRAQGRRHAAAPPARTRGRVSTRRWFAAIPVG